LLAFLIGIAFGLILAPLVFPPLDQLIRWLKDRWRH
jgi:hypothetical protein